LNDVVQNLKEEVGKPMVIFFVCRGLIQETLAGDEFEELHQRFG
jgi:hypothetical protein